MSSEDRNLGIKIYSGKGQRANEISTSLQVTAVNMTLATELRDKEIDADIRSINICYFYLKLLISLMGAKPISQFKFVV